MGIPSTWGLPRCCRGNAGGGFRVPINNYRYETSQDAELFIDTQKAGWWRGGKFRLLIEAREGKSVNATQGTIYAVNMDALYPVPFPLDEDVWAIPVYSYTHIISPRYLLTVGKIQSRPQNEFASSEKTQFLSNRFNLLPPYGSIIPTSDFWGYVLTYRATQHQTLSVLIANPRSTATTFKPEQAINGLDSYALNYTALVTPGGHPGHQRVTLAYTTHRHGLRFVVPGLYLTDQPTVPPTPVSGERNDWIIGWDMDQYLYNVDGNPHRGLGIFAKATYSDGRVNAIQYFVNAGIGAKGLSRSRPDDSFGIGIGVSKPSSHIPEVIKPFVQNDAAIEAYYDYAVFPWLHVAPDVQWIFSPTRKSAGKPLVLGIRVQTTL